MVASFLTSNLTVSFILGLALNAPLVVADQASSVMGPKLASVVRSWSLARISLTLVVASLAFRRSAIFLVL